MCRAKREPRPHKGGGVPTGAGEGAPAGARKGQAPEQAPQAPEGAERATPSAEPKEGAKGSRDAPAGGKGEPNGRKSRAGQRAQALRRRARGAGDAPKQGNKSGGTRNRQSRRGDGRAEGARRQQAPDAAPTRAVAKPTQPTERNKLQSGAQGGGSVGPTRAPRPHLRDDRAAWYRRRIAIASPSDRGRISGARTRGRAHSVHVRAENSLCLSGFREVCVGYLYRIACRIY